MRSQIKLGRVFGIEIGLHYSWFFIALLIVFSLFQQFHATNQDWGDGIILVLSIATGVLFFVSLLLHELSHSLFAKSRGLPVREITLFALGGVSQIEKNPSSAKTEFWMAFVGPVSSACIGLICLGLRTVAGPASGPAYVMLSWLGYINLALAGFNMIPGYPLDGGRILRAAIWWKTGDAERSTRMAARVGQVVGGVFIALGIVQFFGGAGFGGLWIAFIGWFLLQAASESYLQVGLAQALNGVTVEARHDARLSDGGWQLESPALRRRDASTYGKSLLHRSGQQRTCRYWLRHMRSRRSTVPAGLTQPCLTSCDPWRKYAPLRRKRR